MPEVCPNRPRSKPFSLCTIPEFTKKAKKTNPDHRVPEEQFLERRSAFSRLHLCLGIHVAHVLNVPCRDFLDTGFCEWPGVGRVPTRHAKVRAPRFFFRRLQAGLATSSLRIPRWRLFLPSASAFAASDFKQSLARSPGASYAAAVELAGDIAGPH